MQTLDLIAIGASAGGVAALQRIAADLPGGLPAAVLVVQHVHPSSVGYLAEILDRAGPLPARNAVDGEPIRPGHIIVAPPDRHLLIAEPGRVQLSRGPRENRARPAIDPLMRSAALTFGRRVIGVILTGHLDDGAIGLRSVKLCGGTTVVQDPADAEVPEMPRAALRQTPADHVVSLDEIGPLLIRLAGAPAPKSLPEGASVMAKELAIEAAIAAGDTAALTGLRELGEPSLFTCPDCHGALLELRNSRPPRFRCHTGHAFTADGLLHGLAETGEEALWGAVRVLQEQSMLLSHLAGHARAAGNDTAAERWAAQSRRERERADSVRQLLNARPIDEVGT